MRSTLPRKAITASLAVAALVAAGAVSSPAEPGARAAAPAKVSMEDDFFAPTKAKVPVGGKVKWTNSGKVAHNVVFPGGFASDNLSPGETVVRKFKRAGRFPYSCTLHPGMKGVAKVLQP